ncbi:MAG: hypothetical protein HY078_09860 [Elusimicrobia bacterium]|nr:hypothetical protein [Elusimicrobiota bacterium]
MRRRNRRIKITARTERWGWYFLMALSLAGMAATPRISEPGAPSLGGPRVAGPARSIRLLRALPR